MDGGMTSFSGWGFGGRNRCDRCGAFYESFHTCGMGPAQGTTAQMNYVTMLRADYDALIARLLALERRVEELEKRS